MAVSDLLRFAETPFQRTIVEGMIEHGSQRKCAKALGLAHGTVGNTLSRLRKKQARVKELGPVAHTPMMEGQELAGVSTMFDEEGNIKMQWVKTRKDAEKFMEQYTAFIENLASRVEGRAKPIPRPPIDELGQDMAIVIPMGDPHIGLYTWAKEAEADFDCRIAEELFTGAVEYLVDVSPPAEELVLINLGDFFHSDTVDNKTLHSGHTLDVDGRWAKVQDIGYQIMIHCINRALEKYPRVVVHNAIGNHDEHTSQALSMTMNAWYRNEPRVEIVRTPSKFWYYEWGRSMIGVHHGHVTKPADVPMAMAAHEPKMWGRTHYRYAYLGHKHNSMKLERPGALVEQFRTLAPKDAWHWGHAQFISMRDMQAIFLHKRFGDVGRRICPVEYLEGLDKDDKDPR